MAGNLKKDTQENNSHPKKATLKLFAETHILFSVRKFIKKKISEVFFKHKQDVI
jgi:hypothetical protein